MLISADEVAGASGNDGMLLQVQIRKTVVEAACPDSVEIVEVGTSENRGAFVSGASSSAAGVIGAFIGEITGNWAAC